MLVPWKKSYDKPRQHIKKQRHHFAWTITTKVHIVQAMVFPVTMYGRESWATKKDKYWRTDAFKLWCWRRPLRLPWTARRSKQSILKEINPEYSLEGLMLKLKLQYFGHLMWRASLLEKTLKCWKRSRAGEERGNRGWDGWMASLTQWTWVWANSRKQWRLGNPGLLWSMGLQRVGHDFATEKQKQLLYFCFIKNFHTVLHSDFTNLYSHQQCRRVPLSPHPFQHLFFPQAIFITALLLLHFKLSIFCIWVSPSLLDDFYHHAKCPDKRLSSKNSPRTLHNPPRTTSFSAPFYRNTSGMRYLC